MIPDGVPEWNEILPDKSKFSEDLREVQKTVQNYGNRHIHLPAQVHQIQNQMETMVKYQKETLEILHDIQKRVKNLEDRPSSSGGKKRIDFGTVPYLHQKGNPTEVIRKMTDDEKLIALIKGKSIKN